MTKTSGARPEIRREFLANLGTWVMQELEHGRDIDEIASSVWLDRYRLMMLVMMGGYQTSLTRT